MRGFVSGFDMVVVWIDVFWGGVVCMCLGICCMRLFCGLTCGLFGVMALFWALIGLWLTGGLYILNLCWVALYLHYLGSLLVLGVGLLKAFYLCAGLKFVGWLF